MFTTRVNIYYAHLMSVLYKTKNAMEQGIMHLKTGGHDRSYLSKFKRIKKLSPLDSLNALS